MNENVILINKMCTGSYTVSNIGHEIINYFMTDDNKVYIYISPYGNISKDYDDKIKTILLTSSLSNGRVEIIAKIDNPKQEIYYDKERKNKKTLKEIHDEQVKKYKDVYYAGKTLEQVFKNNYKNDEAIHITFSADINNIKKPKKHIFITENREDKNSDDAIYVHINRNIASSSLKQYIKQNGKVEKDKEGKDYDIIVNECLEKSELWEEFKLEKIKEKDIEEFISNDKINFLQLIEKEDEEQIYTNLMWYWFSRKNVFNMFLKYLKDIDKIEDNLSLDTYELNKEKVIPGGRTDILALGEENIIVVENKVLSGINGKKSGETKQIQDGSKIEERTQLSKYITGIDEKQRKGEFYKEKGKKNKKDTRKIIGLIFIPDYREVDVKNEIRNLKEDEVVKKYYKIVKYSEIYNFFIQSNITKIIMNDVYGKKYYSDFINALELQKQNNLSDKNKIEMKRKFIYAIKNA